MEKWKKIVILPFVTVFFGFYSVFVALCRLALNKCTLLSQLAAPIATLWKR